MSDVSNITAVHAEGFEFLDPNGDSHAVKLDDIFEVVILTTAEGPLTEDCFWVVTTGESRVIVSNNDPLGEELAEVLGKLPGFNFDAMIDSMLSVTEEIFVCFRRHGPLLPE